ncbi:MAG TPA: hydrogenase maturation nickel metallochaperone HypA [bacterium]|nr:hydrogenase maturation nickel metallochaperone HypA [bacterium]HPR89333.1 hydrogenase maturation nickel metallochaperone HypA [bacterium]
MHELSIAQALIRAVVRQMQERGITAISRIVVRIGPWSGVMAEALQFNYQLIRKDTPLASAELLIDEPPLTALCQACGHTATLDLLATRCPACGSEHLTLQGSDELEILRLEIDPHPAP